MATIDPEDAAPCATCDHRWTDVDGGSGWLHLEVTRHGPDGGFDFHDAEFCSQQHAVEWLRRPLPEPMHEAPYQETLRDRLAETAVALFFGLVVALAALGLWTAVRFVIDLI